MSGFYPRTKQVYKVRRNNEKECYEIVYCSEQKVGEPCSNWMVHRSGITTRRDANNQCVALNSRFGVVYG